MNINKKGFTLIEMLVVVLIIGILAAIALPQYRKAVLKARMSEGLIQLKAIAEADQVCRMRKGGEICQIDELDITVPGDCDEDGICWTDSFVYTASRGFRDSENINATAGSTKEDVCFCYLTNGTIVLRQDGSGCGHISPYNFSELLDIPEDTENICSCC